MSNEGVIRCAQSTGLNPEVISCFIKLCQKRSPWALKDEEPCLFYCKDTPNSLGGMRLFPKNAKPQFENAKTQFENPKTQFGNCKTLGNRQFYASHQNKFNAPNQFWCNQQKLFLKPHFYT